MKSRNITYLAQQLRLARRYANLTQKDLAKRMKTKQEAISCAERGNVTSIRWAEKFVKACGFTLDIHCIMVRGENMSFW